MTRIIRNLAVISAAAAVIGGAAGAGTVFAANDNGGGHTPVTLCHWVPAHGGSYIVITVDDDGSSGNKNLRGHAGHEHDIIPAEDGVCPADGDDSGGGED